MTPAAQAEAALRVQRKEAAQRRLALQGAGCSTYTIGVRYGKRTIICLCCGFISRAQGDLTNKYCGFCEEFHSEKMQTPF